MGDFYQNGVITTLHNLSQRPLAALEAELVQFSKSRPMSLVLPSLYSELQGPALHSIVENLTEVPYLDEIVIGLDRATEAEYREALGFFSRLPQHHRVIWNDGPRLQSLHQKLVATGLSPGDPGKGRNVWFCFGYVLASGRGRSVALHDCDILTYNRDLLARLIYPVANPSFNYTFCKGYYARVADGKINGRVSRLLVTPLLRALKKTIGQLDYLEYLDSYRYPLAGEFSLRRDALLDIRIPSDWGLEIGVLSEMKRNYATNRICQVDIADTYDHKHQDLSPDNDKTGLSKMSIDISKAVFRKLATNGVVFSTETFRSIKATYYRIALDFVETYNNDAVINGLTLDIHKEELAIEMFAENILKAGIHFLDNPMETPFIPSWNRVMSALPDLSQEFLEAVDADMQEFSPVSSVSHSAAETLHHRVMGHLHNLYPERQAAAILKRLLATLRLDQVVDQPVPHGNLWDQEDIIAITYGDSIQTAEEKPLQTLHRFFNRHLRGYINGLHILPFFPWSSDDGFSVIDYTSVNEGLGDWQDIEAIARDYNLMADLVINHCSARSRWFENFKARLDPGKDYFVETDPRADLSRVVRPRTSALLREVETLAGQRHVWCTFSHDQVDLNFRNPDVLIEFARIIRQYLDAGVRIFRLDAIAFLWKDHTTSSINLPQTHEMVRLLRTLIEHCDKDTIIITETNIPNRENLAYFGNANEAHIIYNFSLPPLLLHALICGDARHLKTWMMSMPPAQNGTAYLNFLASHDGIGLRPAEGLLSSGDIDRIAGLMQRFGGRISWRALENGKNRPYEINITLFDALKGTLEQGEDQFQVERFICAHTIMLALEGIPAIYLHSLFGTQNDYQRLEHTSQNRSINRRQWDIDDLEAVLNSAGGHHREVFERLKTIIAVRRGQAAFHPNATQFTMHVGNTIFAFWRQSGDRDQSIFCLHNISDTLQTVPLADINLIELDDWRDLISGEQYANLQDTITLQPYQCVWISNR